MEAALETCRHAVVLLSHAFLGRPSPRAELQFAFERMQHRGDFAFGDDQIHGFGAAIFNIGTGGVKMRIIGYNPAGF